MNKTFHITLGKEICRTYTFQVDAANEDEALKILDEAWGTDKLEEMLFCSGSENDYGINEKRDRYTIIDTEEIV